MKRFALYEKTISQEFLRDDIYGIIVGIKSWKIEKAEPNDPAFLLIGIDIKKKSQAV